MNIPCDETPSPDKPNWVKGLSHSQRMSRYLNSGCNYDVKFIVGQEKKEVLAHKHILSLHSEYFYKLFTESAQNSLEIVTLENDTEEELKWFLEFFYTGNFGSEVQALPLLKFGIKFEVEDLTRWCATILEQSLTSTTVVKIYETACKFNQNELKEKSFQYILNNGHMVLDSAEFLDLTSHDLIKILAFDEFAAINEFQVFQAVVRWAWNRCKQNGEIENPSNLRNAMTDLIPLIRFPAMNKSDFSVFVAPLQILTNDELISIILGFNVTAEQRSQMPPGSPGLFNPKERNWYLPSASSQTISDQPTQCSGSQLPVNWPPPFKPLTAKPKREYCLFRPVGFFPRNSPIKVTHKITHIRFCVDYPVRVTSIQVAPIMLDFYEGKDLSENVSFKVEVQDIESGEILNTVEFTTQLSKLDPVRLNKAPIKFPSTTGDLLQPSKLYKLNFQLTEGTYVPHGFVFPYKREAEEKHFINAGGKVVKFKLLDGVVSQDNFVPDSANALISTIGFKL